MVVSRAGMTGTLKSWECLGAHLLHRKRQGKGLHCIARSTGSNLHGRGSCRRGRRARRSIRSRIRRSICCCRPAAAAPTQYQRPNKQGQHNHPVILTRRSPPLSAYQDDTKQPRGPKCSCQSYGVDLRGEGLRQIGSCCAARGLYGDDGRLRTGRTTQRYGRGLETAGRVLGQVAAGKLQRSCISAHGCNR